MVVSSVDRDSIKASIVPITPLLLLPVATVPFHGMAAWKYAVGAEVPLFEDVSCRVLLCVAVFAVCVTRATSQVDPAAELLAFAAVVPKVYSEVRTRRLWEASGQQRCAILVEHCTTSSLYPLLPYVEYGTIVDMLNLYAPQARPISVSLALLVLG